MKKILIPLILILFFSCKNTKQEIRIGGAIADKDSAVAVVPLITSTQIEIGARRGGKHGQPPPVINYDQDGDGVPDSIDACPTVYGDPLNHGCPVTIVQPPPPPVDNSWVLLNVPPAGSEGGEGSCVAFAIGYGARYTEQFYKTGQTILFSPEYLYDR